MEPHMLGWLPLVTSWLETLPDAVTSEMRKMLEEYFNKLIDPTVEWLRKSGTKVSYLTLPEKIIWQFIIYFVCHFGSRSGNGKNRCLGAVRYGVRFSSEALLVFVRKGIRNLKCLIAPLKSSGKSQ